MKNVFCIMLALLMTLSMVACGQAPETPTEIPVDTPTEAPVETPVETPESTVPPTVEDADANETETYESISFDTLMEYETKIHELGFKEFKIDLIRPAYKSVMEEK